MILMNLALNIRAVVKVSVNVGLFLSKKKIKTFHLKLLNFVAIQVQIYKVDLDAPCSPCCHPFPVQSNVDFIMFT